MQDGYARGVVEGEAEGFLVAIDLKLLLAGFIGWRGSDRKRGSTER